jgi:hypothetical protein
MPIGVSECKDRKWYSPHTFLSQVFHRALQAVDDALKSAAEAKTKTSNGADKAFKNAVEMLTIYGRNYHPGEAVEERMEKAEEEDKSSLKVLNRLKETFHVREELTPLLRRVLILIFTVAAGRGTDNGSRVSSP